MSWIKLWHIIQRHCQDVSGNGSGNDLLPDVTSHEQDSLPW